MNCVMRIITEDNINQIESMSFSNNYKLLSGEKSFASIDTSLMKGGKNNVDNTHDDDGIQLLIPSDSTMDSYDASFQQGGSGNQEDATMDSQNDAQNYQENEQSGGRAQPQPMTQNIVMNCNPNNDTNLEATSSENMGKEWIKMIEPESKKDYYYKNLETLIIPRQNY